MVSKKWKKRIRSSRTKFQEPKWKKEKRKEKRKRKKKKVTCPWRGKENTERKGKEMRMGFVLTDLRQ